MVRWHIRYHNIIMLPVSSAGTTWELECALLRPRLPTWRDDGIKLNISTVNTACTVLPDCFSQWNYQSIIVINISIHCTFIYLLSTFIYFYSLFQKLARYFPPICWDVRQIYWISVKSKPYEEKGFQPWAGHRNSPEKVSSYSGSCVLPGTGLLYWNPPLLNPLFISIL